MKCPSCKEPNLVMSERKGIEIDYCPDCRGIWLDRGELDKILEKSRTDETPQPQAPRNYDSDRDRDRHEHSKHEYKHYKRRKSFLEELFD